MKLAIATVGVSRPISSGGMPSSSHASRMDAFSELPYFMDNQKRHWTQLGGPTRRGCNIQFDVRAVSAEEGPIRHVRDWATRCRCPVTRQLSDDLSPPTPGQPNRALLKKP